MTCTSISVPDSIFSSLLPFHGQRARAAGATDDQTNRRAFAAACDTADDRADRGANARPLDGLLGPATGFNTTFVIGTPGVVTVNSAHVSMQHTSAAVAQLNRVKGEIHAGAAFDFSGLLYRADVTVESRFIEAARIDHSRGKSIADARVFTRERIVNSNFKISTDRNEWNDFSRGRPFFNSAALFVQD